MTNTRETVVTLSGVNPDSHISVELDVEKLEKEILKDE